jgi:hypothetical protein
MRWFLESVFPDTGFPPVFFLRVGDSQALAAFLAAAFQNGASVSSQHTFAKAVLAGAFKF